MSLKILGRGAMVVGIFLAYIFVMFLLRGCEKGDVSPPNKDADYHQTEYC